MRAKARVRRVAAVLALWLPMTAARAAADAFPTASPAPPAPYVSVEEEVSPNYDAEAGSSTQLNWRAQIPYDGGGGLFRLRFPIVTSAPSQSVTGGGDLALYDFSVVNTARGQWLEGITLRVPTAQNSSLGTGKYSVGPAFGYQRRTGPWTLGFFAQDYFSVIGPSSRAPVGKSKLDPVLSYALGGGWGIGLSSMSITYDWVINKWTEVPIGARVTKQFGGALLGSALRPLEASFEAEKNASNVPHAPGWTTRLYVKWVL